ncbi:MAG: hypothetical protein Q7V31_12535 [Parvibaculum sp.]|uniref:hypothetical protein n=1 Tax=Parvibaculum sp. TaxID=2024848 RepID=UPI0027172D2A|nr:hypothetical protein [Parvibaculum sp.]MDO8839746.1 hypothetical protein [Parvibaculum sp.]
MTKYPLILLALLAPLTLAACADPKAEQARLDAIDHTNCVDLGFEPGTEAYGNCRLKMKEIRAKEEGNRSPNIGFGVGIGVSKGF